jgi:lipopolysaccharide biosynthesis protein
MNNIRTIAIYLPQFHPIPENDLAWGEGFTEWTNVKKALPLFDGHYQPHIPHESVGYYDLSDPEVLVKQAAIAKEYGIYGFAYYHYWFNGKRLLNSPLDNTLASGKPDFPFCYIWANENWTKRWDGFDEEVIIKQGYSFDDDRNHIRFLCENVFSDKRYITVDGKPLFLVYRTNQFPDIKKTAKIWREEARLLGFKDLYLVRVEAHGTNVVPSSIGFDSAMRFNPDWQMSGTGAKQSDHEFSITKYNYSQIVLNTLLQKREYKYFRCVFPSWDNTARRKQNAFVFVNTSPYVFRYFLQRAIQFTYKNFENDEQLLFINAWNEWGEGCHIEPDERYGFKYLQICKEAIKKDYTNFEQENKYIEFLENEIEKLYKNNLLLEQKVFVLSKQLHRILGTNYYKIGHLIIQPYRRLKRFFQKKINA